MAVSGGDTPIYDHYFAGGFSTLRGFDFRGASPRQLGVTVGGEFMLLNSAEYLFPITADDTLRGVVFCDTGTVQPTIGNWTDRYRVAPGFGLRVTIPAMGPAPIALDFAFPIVKEPADERQVFSFFVGFLR
jgi:outer membrane protein insertion porin family